MHEDSDVEYESIDTQGICKILRDVAQQARKEVCFEGEPVEMGGGERRILDGHESACAMGVGSYHERLRERICR